MSSVNVSNFPSSFSSFRQIIDSCENDKNKLKNAFSFSKELKEEDFTMNLFIRNISSVIIDYKDLKHRTWKLCIENIKKLFKYHSSEDLMQLQNLNTLVNKIFYHRFTINCFEDYLKSNDNLSKFYPKFQQKDYALSISPLDEIRTKISQSNDLTAKGKLEKIFKDNNIEDNPLQQRKFTTIIINLLGLEIKFIRCIAHYAEIKLVSNNIRNEYFKNADKIIKIGHYDVPLFEIGSIEKDDAFQYLLNMSSIISLKCEGDKTYLGLSETALSLKNRADKINKYLNQLRKIIKNEKIINFIDSTLWVNSLKIENSEDVQNQLMILKENYKDGEIIKNSEILFPFKKIESFLTSIISIDAYDIKRYNPESFLGILKDTVDLWFGNYENQNQLDKECRELLNRIPSKKIVKPAPKYLEKYEIIDFETEFFKQYKASSPVKKAKPVKAVKTTQAVAKKVKPQLVPNPVPKGKEVPNLEFKENISHSLNAIAIQNTFGSPFPYKYDKRVLRWGWDQHEFGKPLPEREFEEYFEEDLKYQRRMQVFHALNPYVDNYLSLGIEGTWINTKNKRTQRIVIPAEITFDGKLHRGFISYGIQANVCYHKCFTARVRPEEILFETIKKTFNENDFPELQKAVISNQKGVNRPKIIEKGESICFQDPITGNVTIEDLKRNVFIKLYNTNALI